MNLYKYMNEDRIKNILIDNKIRFTQPKYFNDPFDVNPSINAKTIENILRKIGLEDLNGLEEVFQSSELGDYALSSDEVKGLGNAVAKKFASIKEGEISSIYKNEAYLKLINENIGVLSLTTKSDNLLMWAHYANEHKGFVIEFDTNFNPFNNKELKVDYKKKRPIEKIGRENTNRVFLTKSVDWKYEDEYRIIKKLDGYSHIGNNIHLFNFPKTSIKSIYCGCDMDVNKKKEILSIIEKDEDLNHLKVFDSSISNKYYELEFKQIR